MALGPANVLFGTILMGFCPAKVIFGIVVVALCPKVILGAVIVGPNTGKLLEKFEFDPLVLLGVGEAGADPKFKLGAVIVGPKIGKLFEKFEFVPLVLLGAVRFRPDPLDVVLGITFEKLAPKGGGVRFAPMPAGMGDTETVGLGILTLGRMFCPRTGFMVVVGPLKSRGGDGGDG